MRRASARRTIAAAAVAALAAHAVSAATALGQDVHLRGEPAPLAGAVVAVAPEAVTIRTDAGPAVIGLDLVRTVTGASADAFAGVRALADRLWRARARIERGDFAGAEPLLDPLVPQLAGRTGPTPSVLFDGLVRCRLARGARMHALDAWLDWLGARGSADDRAAWRGGSIAAGVAIDPVYEVVPELPPVWTNAQTPIDALSSALGARTESADPRVRDLARLYRAAASFELSAETTTPDASALAEPVAAEGSARAHPGVRLTRDMVLARAGTPDERARAIAALEDRLREPGLEPWVEAWCRLGVGRALLRADDPVERRRGVIELLHVPARLSGHVPDLAQLALAHAAVAMDDLGDPEGAASLVAELDRARAASTDVAPLAWSRIDDIRTRHRLRPASASAAGAAGSVGGRTP